MRTTTRKPQPEPKKELNPASILELHIVANGHRHVIQLSGIVVK